MKAGRTFHSEFLAGMHKVERMLRTPVARRMLVFGGEGGYARGGVEVVGVRD